MRNLTLTLLSIALFINAFGNQTKKQIDVAVSSPMGITDFTEINFDQNFVSTFNNNEDVEKVFGPAQSIPFIYSLTVDNTACLINSYSNLLQDATISLGVKVDSLTQFVFSASSVVNFTEDYLITLEDKQIGKFWNLMSGPYTAAINPNEPETGRFYLHVSIPAVFTFTPADCLNENGIVAIQFDPSISWNSVALYDSAGILMQNLPGASGSFSFPGLSEGSYAVQFVFDTSTSITKAVQLNGYAVSAAILNQTAVAKSDEEIQFLAVSHNATNFEWSISDGAIISGINNPYYTFNQGGNFDVVLRAFNSAGCEARDTFYITVQEPLAVEPLSTEKVKIYAASNTIYVNVPTGKSDNWNVEVYSLIGEKMYGGSLQASLNTIALNVAPSYYVVAVSDGKTKTMQRIVMGGR
ncbi:MAG: hypothetical protein U0V74_03175 [Chitinophagales bacterium]